jgi:hypothetical protein
MASIGTFKKSGQEFQGEIVTLSLKSKGVRIVPETTGPATTPPVIGSMSAESRSAPPGQSVPTRAATISRSSSTIRASPLRSTPTSSRTTARPSPSSGPAAASRTATDPDRHYAPPGSTGRGFRAQRLAAVPAARSACGVDRTCRAALLGPRLTRMTQSCQSESRRGMIGYCVVSAVEVEPRIMTLALANAKSMRFSAAKCIVPSRLLRRHGAAVEVAPCTTRLESKSRRACGRAHLPMNLMICSATARGASSGI